MFKNLKSLFVIEEDEGSGKGKGQETQPTTESTEEKIKEVRDHIDTKTPAGKAHPKFTEILFQAMENNNLDGFDYLEYKKSLQSLAKMPMDESTRYQSAYAMAQTMGVSVASLLETTQHYLNVLKREEDKFNKALANQEDTKIEAREKEIQDLQKTINDKAAQIKKLTQEIEQHQKQMAQHKEEISVAAQKMEATKRTFMASYNQLTNQIKADYEKMKQFLK
ncbi:MAG: hypothetical protein R2879_19880 [Saprospiraceae bacterium]